MVFFPPVFLMQLNAASEWASPTFHCLVPSQTAMPIETKSTAFAIQIFAKCASLPPFDVNGCARDVGMKLSDRGTRHRSRSISFLEIRDF